MRHHIVESIPCVGATRTAGNINWHEQNQVLRIYERLVYSGFPDYSVSLETYFNFAKGRGKEGNDRPDIAVFNPSVNGKLNLYVGSVTKMSRDAMKIQKLQALIEVKVAPSKDQALCGIRKLNCWRNRIRDVCPDLEFDFPEIARFIFAGFLIDDETAFQATECGKDLDIDVWALRS